ncbi:MAG: mannose-1-phosphate guanylyltransferase [Nocardioides sp.]|uniref:mannose-1-phosphate guanylyltransferase n=1 Tax=Nocardioides sp. TaxID=35761 RepID=UPI003F06AFA8
MSTLEHFWAVVPAGGAGTRLWPLSRSTSPKFLHDLTGSGRTLIQATVDRLAPLAEDRFLVVTGAAHRDAVLAQLPEVDPGSVVAEPSARDSMAAIGLAAALLERRDPDAVMGSFAADHVIADPGAFRSVVADAVAVAREGWLTTIGITPTHPATGFGYIAPGEPLGVGGGLRVAEFVEKPAAEVAAGYVARGYQWNAGMFVVRPGVLLDLLGEGDPAFAADLRRIAADPSLLDELWPGLPKIALDHAVAEPAAAAGRVAVVPGGFGWDDVGDFASLHTILRAGGDGGEEGVTVLGDASVVRSVDSAGLVVPTGDRLVAVLGLPDVVVVETPDAVLVTTRAHAQDVKSIVAALKEDGHDELV